MVQERSPNAAQPSRYLTKRLSTGEVLDYVTCAGSGLCTMSDALGMRACSFRPVPAKLPEAMSLESSDESAGAEVRLAGKDGPTTLFHVTGAGARLRSGARAGANMILFLRGTQDGGGCPRTLERAVMVADPESPGRDREVSDSISSDGALRDVELTDDPGVAVELRIAHRPSLARMEALMTAARAASAAHLDTLAGCWAQQVLSMATWAQRHHHRPKKRTTVSSLRIDDAGIIVVRSPVRVSR